MPDRSLVLDLESPYHYFNAGVMLSIPLRCWSIKSPQLLLSTSTSSTARFVVFVSSAP